MLQKNKEINYTPTLHAYEALRNCFRKIRDRTGSWEEKESVVLQEVSAALVAMRADWIDARNHLFTLDATMLHFGIEDTQRIWEKIQINENWSSEDKDMLAFQVITSTTQSQCRNIF